MRFLPNRAIFPLTAGIFIALVVSVAAVQWSGSRAVPQEFHYVLPSSKAYLVTGPLKNLWRHGPSHISQLLSEPASGIGIDLAARLTVHLTPACLEDGELANLDAFGIDGERGIAISYLDEANVAVAIPVSDRDRFALFFERLVSSVELGLVGRTAPGKQPVALRIDSNRSEGIRACQRAPDGSIGDFDFVGKAVDLSPGALIDLPPDASQAYFTARRTQAGAAKLLLACTTIYSDDTTGPCTCRLDHADCTPQGRVWEPLPTTEPVFVDDNTALIVTNEELAEGFRPHQFNWLSKLSIGNPQLSEAIRRRLHENFAFFRGDDGLLASAQLLFNPDAPDDGMIAGAVNVPTLPFSGRAHFSMGVGAERLLTRVLLPWQTMQSTFLEQLVTPAATPSAGAGWFSTPGEISINDPALGYYLRFMDAYSDTWRRELHQLGNFEVFLREIMRLENVGHFRFAITGVRDGIPDLVMTLGGSAEQSEQLLSRQREQLRQSRDRQILWGAAQRFRSRRPSEAPVEMEQLLPLLHPEPGTSWTRYRVEGSVVREAFAQLDAISRYDQAVAEWRRCGESAGHESDECLALVDEYLYAPPPQLTRMPLAAAFPLADNTAEADVGSSEYDVIRDDRRLRFLPPPITDNDIEYRIDRDDEADIDKAALREGRFRMAGYVDEAGERLIVASDIETLVAALDMLEHPVNEPRLMPMSKLSAVGEPQFLIRQGLLHPDKAVEDWFRYFLLDFEQYRGLTFDVEPLPSRQGLSATMVWSLE